jgi:hypothetical protein
VTVKISGRRSLKSRQPSDWTEVTQDLSSSGGIGVLGAKTFETSRVSKPRRNYSRRSQGGHVSGDRDKSAFGASGFSKARNSCI